MRKFSMLLVATAMVLGGCGSEGGDGEPLPLDTALGALSAESRATLCSELVSDTPAACWLNAEGEALADAAGVCLARLDAYYQAATVGDVRDCYAGLEGDDCPIEGGACSALAPQNGDNFDVDCDNPADVDARRQECLDLLDCNAWTDLELCLSLCEFCP